MATLSFLKLARNWPKNAVLTLALSCGAIWCHRENPQHRWTTTIHPVYNCWKKNFENLLPVGLLVHTNLFIPSRFWTTNTKFDSCCLRYIATCIKKFIYVHIYILGPKLPWSNFLQISRLSIGSRAHKLFRRFLDFSKFSTKISRNLWRHLATIIRTTKCISKGNQWWKNYVSTIKINL